MQCVVCLYYRPRGISGDETPQEEKEKQEEEEEEEDVPGRGRGRQGDLQPARLLKYNYYSFYHLQLLCKEMFKQAVAV